MASVNTNAAAITALRTLQTTNMSMDKTQQRISTGYKIGEAKDNAAYWAISTTLKSDNKSLSTVKDALGLGASTVDTAYQGLNKAKDVLDEIKSKLTAATQDGVNRDTIQNEISQLQNQLKSIATSSIFSGENWLQVDSSTASYSANKQVVASFSRDASGSVSIGTIGVNITNVALFDASAAAGATGGILNGKTALKDASGVALTIGGTAPASVTGNTSAVGLDTATTTTGGTTDAAAAGNVTAAGAATAATGTAGAAATPTAAKATYTAGGLTVSGGSPAAGDTLTVTLTGGLTFTVNPGTGGVAPTASQMKTAIDAAGLTGVTASVSGSGLVLTTTATGSSVTPIKITGVTSSGSGTWAAATSTDTNGTAGTATAGSLTTGAAVTTGLATGDVVTFKYRVDGASTDSTASVTLGASDYASAGALATKLASVTLTGATAAVATSTSLKFTSGTTGTSSNFVLSDVTVQSSTGVQKNASILTSFVGSKAGTAVTNDIGTNYATKFAATDKLVFNLTVDGTAVGPITAAAGADGTALANNLNNLPLFSGAAVASYDTTTKKLTITSKTTGANSNVVVNSVAFTDASGAAQSKTSTGFVNVKSAGSAQASTAFTAITLDSDDTLSFQIQVDGGTAKTVTISQNTVNTALGISTGTIGTAANFKTVVDAALAAAGVSTSVVSTSLGGTNSDQLTFTSKTVGTASSTVTLSSVVASAGGGRLMSVDAINISSANLATLGATTSDQVKQVLTAYINVVNTAINKVTAAAASLGSVASRIDMQKSFVDTLMDSIDKGVGNLIDADMSEESTKLQALQVKQQLGVQALAIANQSAQSILSLFK